MFGTRALCLAAARLNRAMPLTVAAAWTPPFVLHACSIAAIALAVLTWPCDVRGWWQKTPLQWLGMNAIALYIGHMLFGGWFPFGFQAPSSHDWEVVEAVVCWACWGLVTWQLWWHGLSLRI